MRKKVLKTALVLGITVLGAFWFSIISALFFALLGRQPIESEYPVVSYSFLILIGIVLPFCIRAMYRKYVALQPVTPSSAWPKPTKPKVPSEDEDPKGWYSIIEDAGYAGEISYEEYAKEKSIDVVLSRHGKAFVLDSKDDAVEELLAELAEHYPQFTHSYQTAPGSSYLPGERRNETWYYNYKGTICGEDVNAETDFPHFVPDVLNPILATKMGFQLLFAFPGSDSYGFILVFTDRVEKVKSNPYYWEYPLLEHWYGYKRAGTV